LLDDNATRDVVVDFDDGSDAHFPNFTLPADISAHLFQRDGRVRKITVTVGSSQLFGD
jgi:hypothetical protein